MSVSKLRDIVAIKAEEVGVEIKKARKMTPQDALWAKHKTLVDSLPADFMFVLEHAPSDLITKREGKTKDMADVVTCVLKLPHISKTFETTLEVTEVAGKGYKATYYAFRNNPYVCYIRQLTP